MHIQHVARSNYVGVGVIGAGVVNVHAACESQHLPIRENSKSHHSMQSSLYLCQLCSWIVDR